MHTIPDRDIDDDDDDDDDDDHNQDHAKSTQTYTSLNSINFYRLILFQILWIFPWIAIVIVLPSFGAHFFGGCISQQRLRVTYVDGCEPDFVTYNFYLTLFISIGGLISFLFASMVGRMSDSFGRKAFIIFSILCFVVPKIIFLVIYIDFLLYWIFSLISDVNGADQILPAFKAMISDIVSPADRVNAFGRVHAAMGLGLIVGALLAVALTLKWSAYMVIIVMSSCYIVLLLYTLLFLPETIDIHHNRVEITNAVWKNPFKPLCTICHSPFMAVTSMLSFVGALIEAGIMSSIFSYIGYALNITDDAKASMAFGTYTTIVSVVLIPTSVWFLPFLKRRHIHYSHIICISVCFRIISLGLLALLSFDLHGYGQYALYVAAVFHGAGMYHFAVLEGIVSEYVTKDCQGIAFGVNTSYKAIAGILAPFSFGLVFTVMSGTDLDYLFILLGIALCVVEVILALVPLKMALLDLRPQSVEIKVRGDALKEIERVSDEEHEEAELRTLVEVENGTAECSGTRTIGSNGRIQTNVII